jgi:RNA polymerase sigma-70 factor (ECF subfamily)
VHIQGRTWEGTDVTGRRDAELEWIRAAVREHEGALVRYAARLLRGDVDRARDVVQDVFLRLWEADRAAIRDHLAQWLFTVCRNRALDVCRKEGRMSALHDSQLERPDRGGEDSPARGSEEREGSGTLLGLLEALPPRQQEAIRLKFQNGLSYRDISQVMETTVSNVGVLIHTGLKTIRAKATKVSGAEVSR